MELFLLALLLVFSISMGYLLWPRNQRDFGKVILTAGIFGTMVFLGSLVSNLVPINREVIENRTIIRRYRNPPKVIYKDRIVYKAPDGPVAPVDVKAACSGKYPIEIVKIYTSGKDDDLTSWITGHGIGSRVLLTCGQPGDFTSMWKVGDIVQFVRGTAQ